MSREPNQSSEPIDGGRAGRPPAAPEPSGEAPRPPLRSERSLRKRLDMKGEFLLALLPTLTILLVLALVEALSRQRLLFASLAASAFLIYLDPQLGTNTVRTLVTSHLLAAIIGVGVDAVLGGGYTAAGAAMVVTIALMIALDVFHPPAVATSLTFAFRGSGERNLTLFLLALAVISILVVLQRAVLHVLARLTRTKHRPEQHTASGP